MTRLTGDAMKSTGALALLWLMGSTASMRGAEDSARANPWLTITPFQTATFVGDDEAARLLNKPLPLKIRFPISYTPILLTAAVLAPLATAALFFLSGRVRRIEEI